MSVVYPDDYPQSVHDAVMAAMQIKDEDIDLSDIPEITDEEAALAKPVGDMFVERGRRNSIFINKLLNEYYARKGVIL